MDGSFAEFEEINDPARCAPLTLPGFTPCEDGFVQVTILSEDRASLGDLANFLKQHGLSTRIMAGDHPRILDAGYGADELVIIHGAFPGMTDWGLLRHFSSRDDRPAIIVMTDDAETIDRVVGLELGADDYVSNALHNRELLARIRAVLRRRHPLPSLAGQPELNPLPAAPAQAAEKMASDGDCASFDAWEVNFRDRELRYGNAELVNLTRTEFNMLAIFLRHAGQTIARRTLLDLIYSEGPERERTVDVLIARLRRKLERSGDETIRTVRTRGYLFLPQVRWMRRESDAMPPSRTRSEL